MHLACNLKTEQSLISFSVKEEHRDNPGRSQASLIFLFQHSLHRYHKEYYTNYTSLTC